ncbi:MAG: recombination mediator RecR [Magnetococcus sp. DMHC-6]
MGGLNLLPTVERAIRLFSRFPGFGRKSAQRLVYHFLRQQKDEIGQLITVLEDLKRQVRPCMICFNLAESDKCVICADPSRDTEILCVVEEPQDLQAIESTHLFKGLYHVLGGHLSPLDNVGPEELHLAQLEHRLKNNSFRELILATNPTIEGDATAHYVAQLAQPWVKIMTRLGLGLPMGGELEYVDESTLYQALAGRRHYI